MTNVPTTLKHHEFVLKVNYNITGEMSLIVSVENDLIGTRLF